MTATGRLIRNATNLSSHLRLSLLIPLHPPTTPSPRAYAASLSASQARNKGRISRYLANKCSIASRIDCFSEQSTSAFGAKLREQVEERLAFYDKGAAPTKNITAMQAAIEAAGFGGAPAAGGGEKKKKEKKEKKDKKRDKSEAEEAAAEEEEAAPKKKKSTKEKKAAAADSE